MRELKFRVWSVDDKKFVKSIYHAHTECYICISAMFGNPVIFSQYGDEVELDETKYIIQQYTGLKDSSGNEIYEGDILSHNGKIGTVYYNADRAGFVLEWEYSSHEQNYVNLTCDVAYESVNAGNMFENKELLK
jgi:uncharacterized phage protein (TIGR01671 family)